MKNSSYLLILAGLFVASCSPSKQSSLLSDQATSFDSSKPDTTPSEYDLSLSIKIGGATGALVAKNQLRIDIGGDCSVSTYKRHEIQVFVYNNNAFERIPIISLALANPGSIGPSGPNLVTYCEQGKFNFAIDRSGASIASVDSATASYLRNVFALGNPNSFQRKIKVKLVAFDSKNQPVSPATASKEQTLNF